MPNVPYVQPLMQLNQQHEHGIIQGKYLTIQKGVKKLQELKRVIHHNL